jgi:hypothetical protein
MLLTGLGLRRFRLGADWRRANRRCRQGGRRGLVVLVVAVVRTSVLGLAVETAADGFHHIVFERARMSLLLGDAQFRQNTQNFPRFYF